MLEQSNCGVRLQDFLGQRNSGQKKKKKSSHVTLTLQIAVYYKKEQLRKNNLEINKNIHEQMMEKFMYIYIYIYERLSITN